MMLYSFAIWLHCLPDATLHFLASYTEQSLAKGLDTSGSSSCNQGPKENIGFSSNNIEMVMPQITCFRIRGLLTTYGDPPVGSHHCTIGSSCHRRKQQNSILILIGASELIVGTRVDIFGLGVDVQFTGGSLSPSTQCLRMHRISFNKSESWGAGWVRFGGVPLLGGPTDALHTQSRSGQ